MNLVHTDTSASSDASGVGDSSLTNVRATMLRRMDIVQHHCTFDAEWYSRTFADVPTSSASFAHFSRFGAFLGRGVSAAFPTLDCLPELHSALSRCRKVSYCIPIMNRPDDIKGTLEFNLSENSPLSDFLEFIVVFLDNDLETQEWVKSRFPEELRSGYLRVVNAVPMDTWHFGKAKNSHQELATGEIFSSLDGDNFVSLAETRQLIDVAEKYGNKFVFHHFSGEWGDGSSGRISLPTETYRRIGYDESFMPRQYDELDVIISALSSDADLIFIRHPSDRNAFSSQRTRKFLERARINNPTEQVTSPARAQPLNPKGSDYVKGDPILDGMMHFNQAACFLKNSPAPHVTKYYLKQAEIAKYRLLESFEARNALDVIFRSSDVKKVKEVELTASDISLFSCVKDDALFLPEFIRHHRDKGVKHFFIVDDGSSSPVEELLPFDYVSVLRPKVGKFKTSKTLWLEILVKAFVAADGWAITADADELIDLPPAFDSFEQLGAYLSDANAFCTPGLLLDMVPGTPLARQSGISMRDYHTALDHHAWVQGPVPLEYRHAGPVKWGFGRFAALSWMTDLRFHAFGTYDSLRKVPFFSPRPLIHLNQGFHTLHNSDGSGALPADIWRAPLLLVRHFKLAKLFSDLDKERMHRATSVASQYHERTSQNIQKIFGDVDGVRSLESVPLEQYSSTPLKNMSASDFFDPT